jgi:tRNA_anti-like
MKREKVFTLAGFAILIVLVAGFYVYREYNRVPSKTVERSIDFTINAVDLLNEFTQDEVASNQKYIGKTLLIKGTIKKISKEEDNSFFVHLSGNDELSTVRCRMEINEGKHPATSKPGEIVQIKGLCNGFNADDMGLGSDVLLTQCLLAENNAK